MNSHSFATAFVDNLPELIRKIWVYNLFSKYGKIRDIYIPNKKSKVSGNNFGFVRFFLIKDAEKAIAEINNSWYWGMKLRVNFARFQRKVDVHNGGSYGAEIWKQNDVQRPIWHHNNGSPNKTGVWKNNTHINQGNGFLSNYPHNWTKGKFQSNRRDFNTKKGIINNHIAPVGTRGKEIWRKKGVAESSKQGEMRTEQVFNKVNANPSKGTITVKPMGNGWLTRSVIAKIKRLISAEDLEYVFKREGIQKVQIKPIGGRYVIITFPDETTRDLVINEKWILCWFDEIKKWNGDQAKVERFVWLSCYGMPLHGWSHSTFKDIGNFWGEFLQVDESTNLEEYFVKARLLIATDQYAKLDGSMELMIDNVIYPIRVIEEDTFRFIKKSLVNIPTDLSLEKQVPIQKEDDQKNSIRESSNDVEGSKSNMGNDDEMESSKAKQMEMPVINEVVEDSIYSSLGAENSIMGKEIVLDSFEGLSMDSQPSLSSQNCLEFQETEVCNGLAGGIFDRCTDDNCLHLASRTDNQDGNGVVNEDLEHNDNLISEEDLNKDHFEANQIPIQAAVKGIKGKSKRKDINEILGYSKVDKGTIKGKKKNNKCVMLRSAVAAAALSASISSGNINNRNRILLDEAKAIWEVDKMFGIRYDGDEMEVISKIADMEALNKARADHQS